MWGSAYFLKIGMDDGGGGGGGLLSLRTVYIYLFPFISKCRLKGGWLGRRGHDTEQTQARDFWLRGYKKIMLCMCLVNKGKIYF